MNKDQSRFCERGFSIAASLILLLASTGMVAAKAAESTSARLKSIRLKLDGQDKSNALSKEELQNLKAELDEIIAKSPGADAYNLRASVKANLRDLQDALVDANCAVELDPKGRASRLGRGTIECQLKLYPACVDDISRAIAAGEAGHGAYLLRATAYAQLGKWSESVADLDKVIVVEKEKNSLIALIASSIRSRAYVALKEPDKALADLNYVLEFKASSGEKVPTEMLLDAHKLKASVLFSQNKSKEAVQELRLAMPLAGGERMIIPVPAGDKLMQSSDPALASRSLAIIEPPGSNPTTDKDLRPYGSPPPDRPVTGERDKIEELIAPYVAQAKKSLPEVKERYRKGLAPGRRLSVTTRIYGPDGKTFEQVFVAVRVWEGNMIQGNLASRVNLPNHKVNEPLEVDEREVLDWTIVQPDGSEEGNFVGKFLDTLH